MDRAPQEETFDLVYEGIGYFMTKSSFDPHSACQHMNTYASARAIHSGQLHTATSPRIGCLDHQTKSEAAILNLSRLFTSHNVHPIVLTFVSKIAPLGLYHSNYRPTWPWMLKYFNFYIQLNK